MGIRVKVDEDLPGELAGLLRTAGHDAVTVVDEGLSGASDGSVWEHVQQEKRCLLTADRGFANARKFPVGTHAGIVLFRLPRESRTGYIRLAQSFLSHIRTEDVAGAVITVSPEAIRVHRTP